MVITARSGWAAKDRGMDLPLIETIAWRLTEGAGEHGDKDFSATYLTSTPKKPSR